MPRYTASRISSHVSSTSTIVAGPAMLLMFAVSISTLYTSSTSLFDENVSLSTTTLNGGITYLVLSNDVMRYSWTNLFLLPPSISWSYALLSSISMPSTSIESFRGGSCTSCPASTLKSSVALVCSPILIAKVSSLAFSTTFWASIADVCRIKIENKIYNILFFIVLNNFC